MIKKNYIPYIIFSFIVFFLHYSMAKTYIGNQSYLLLFSFSFNLLFMLGFSYRNSYFDSFLGTFLWLGFWLKFTIRLTYFDGQFHEPIGEFDSSPTSYDEVILISSLAALSLIIATIFRRIVLPDLFLWQKHYPAKEIRFYQKHKILILASFLLLAFFWSASNFHFGIYQRGEMPRLILPYGLSGGFKWLLLFGGATFSSIFIYYELIINNKKSIFIALFIGLLETTFSATSMISRGMILNSSALIFSFLKERFQRYKSLPVADAIICTSLLFPLFLISVYYVNFFRSNNYVESHISRPINVKQIHDDTKILFLDRWVGIESLMAVTSSSHYGWNVFKKSLDDKYTPGKLSFYDQYMIESAYRNTDLTLHNFISIPGFIAYFYYPRSKIFLFFILILFSFAGFFFEWIALKAGGGNTVLASIIGLTVAYRFIHFGYVPTQSYLLFGSIILNLVIIYLARLFINRVS